MSQSTTEALDPAVAKSLADYDRSRMVQALQDATAAAAQHDGEIPPDPVTARTMARSRLADWMAILSRIRRDLDPEFDPDHPPEMNIVPPGPYGNQYPPGVSPRDVKDPEMRHAYIEAIEKNRQRIKNFSANLKLFEARQVVVEKAAQSLGDARVNLGLTGLELTEALQRADILPRDRSALMALTR
jgi:hypothetical protein